MTILTERLFGFFFFIHLSHHWTIEMYSEVIMKNYEVKKLIKRGLKEKTVTSYGLKTCKHVLVPLYKYINFKLKNVAK